MTKARDVWCLETITWVVVCALVAVAQLVLPSCKPVKSVETSVRVSQDACREAGGTESVVSLDCLSGEVSVKVEMDRLAWNAIRIAADGGAPVADGGDAADAAAVVTLSLDAAHCKEDPRDNKTSASALLSCRGSGLTSYAVSMNRQEWLAIKSRGVPSPVPTPIGK